MASDSTPPTLTELIEQANRLKGMRAEIVREVNELFATIAEVAENEREGKYGAMVAFAARMQDERDEAREKIKRLEAELTQAKALSNEAIGRASILEQERNADNLAAVGALTIRSAAIRMRDALHNIRMEGVSSAEFARMAARAHELVVSFDEETKDYIPRDLVRR